VLGSGKEARKGWQEGEIYTGKSGMECALLHVFFFLTWGIRTSLRASQLITEFTEHPASHHNLKNILLVRLSMRLAASLNRH
jgi:hypothetical protein